MDNEILELMKMRMEGIWKKVDEQGRFVLPSDWRAAELKESKEVFVIKGKGYLKIVPKKKVDLTRFFDTADLGMNIEAVSYTHLTLPTNREV